MLKCCKESHYDLHQQIYDFSGRDLGTLMLNNAYAVLFFAQRMFQLVNEIARYAPHDRMSYRGYNHRSFIFQGKREGVDCLQGHDKHFRNRSTSRGL